MRRMRVGALAASLLLAIAGVVVLVFQPVQAGATELVKTAPDFTVHPGETLSKTFDHPMVGAGGEGYGTAECRDDPVFSLTCATNRIKIAQRLPGYFLRITTSWLGQSNILEAVPDVDTYLYDSVEGHLNSDDVGGATSAELPEQIKVINPAQDEYDLVVVDYAGPVTDYTVLVQYTNESAGPSPAPADLTLTPHTPPTDKTISKPLVGYTGDPAFYPLVTIAPDVCRNDPTRDLVCDVYRLKLNRTRSKDAQNFVVVTLDWDVTTSTPALPAVAVGVNEAQIPHMAMFVWDTPGHMFERGQVGGQDSTVPQRVAFTAFQDEYDLVVQVTAGAVPTYKLHAFLSDEIFAKPFELLDPITGLPINGGSNPDFGDLSGSSDSPSFVPPLALAPIDVDSQIAGIGLGSTEQFDSTQLTLGRDALRNTSAVTKAPSGLILWLALVIAPFGLLILGVVYMRRRHTVLI